MAGWVAGNCETITNSASAEARVEAWAELGKGMPKIDDFSYVLGIF